MPSDPKPDPLEAIFGPIVDDTTCASGAAQRELPAEIERRAAQAEANRKAVIKRAIPTKR